jgi:pSer/pThr/pTyr-binding forkhead associated (FHA) protein
MAGEQLRVTEGNARGQRLVVDAELLIGRAMSEEGRLGDDPGLSRRHARVARAADDRLTIEDLGSANGTFVNGERIGATQALEAGDVVRLGDTLLRVTSPAGAAAQLVIVEGPGSGSHLPVDGVVIGRTVEGEGRLSDDPELSRRHARVASDADGRVTIEDLGSANGTFVNGASVSAPRVLRGDDLVRVGLTTLRLVEVERATTAAAPEAEPEVTPPPPRTPRLVALADLAARGRVGILAIAVVLTVVGVVFGVSLPGHLKAGDDFADRSSQSSDADGLLARVGGAEPAPGAIAIVRASGGRIGSPALDTRASETQRDAERARGARSGLAQRTAARVARVMRADPNVGRVRTYYQGAAAAFLSRDRRATYVLAFLREGTDRRATAKRLRAQLSFVPGVSLGGDALAGDAVGRRAGTSLWVGLAIAVPLLFLLSLAALRGFVAALLPALAGVVTVFVALLGVRLADGVTAQSSFVLGIVAGLGLGLGAVYGLLIVARYCEVSRSEPRAEALRRTLATAGRTVLFSTAAVAVALLSLMIFPQRTLDSMGVGGAIGALVAGAIALIAVPALLSVLGERVAAVASAEPSGRWQRLAQGVARKPVLVLVATAAVLLALGLPFLGLKSTGADAGVLPKSSSARQVQDALGREFAVDPTATIRLAVFAPPSAGGRLRAYAGQLERLPGVASVGTPQRLDQRNWQLDVQPAQPAFDGRTRDLVGRIRDTPAPFPVTVAGEAAAFVDGQDALSSELPFVLAVLVLSALAILFLMTRSAVLPVVTVLTNFLVLSATFGLVVAIFQHSGLEGVLGYTSRGALYSTEPELLLAVVFALSTALCVVPGIREATAAALLLAVAIGAFAVSAVDVVGLLAVGAVLAVLIHATFVRPLLLPAALALVGGSRRGSVRP